MLHALRHRRFRLLWLGASASLLGDGVYLIALAWHAYTLSPDPRGLAVLGTCATASQLVALLAAGLLSDRMDRRRLLLAADLIRVLAVGTVAALVLSGDAGMAGLAVLSVVYGLGAGFAAPAFDALVPELVPDEDLEQANALEQFLRPTMLRLAGPALGGFLVAVAGPGSAFAVDAASFAVSGLCLALMGRGEPAVEGGVEAAGASPGEAADEAADEPVGLVGEAVAGWRFVRSRRWLWGTFVSAAITYVLFIGPTEVLLPWVARESLSGSSRELGIIFAVGGLGAIVAAATVSRTGLPRRHFTFMYACWAVATLAVAGYGLATRSWHLMVACFVVNGLEAAGTVAWATTKQRLVPNGFMGRVSSLDWLISIAGLPLSYALTAPVAALIGARATLIGAGVLGALVTGVALFLPGVREPDGALAASVAVVPGQREPAETPVEVAI